MANISKIKLPNVTDPYQLIDSTALHSDDINTTVTSTSTEKVGSASAVKQAYDKGVEAYNHADSLFEQLGSFLTFKGTKATAAEIKALTSARVGDVWLETTGHSEWICIKAINGTASASSWEKAGSSADVSAFVTAVDAGAITDTVPQTFEGHQVGEFVLKTDVVNNLTSTATNVPLSAAKGKALKDNLDAIQGSTSENSTNITNLTNNKLDKSGGTLTGALVAQNNSNYTTKQVRNVILSTSEPTSSDGANGDIWIKYTN